MQRNLSLATLFSEFLIPVVTTASQLFSNHLSSSQFSQPFSTALKVIPSLPPSAQLFSPLPCSFQLSPTTLTSAHLVLNHLSSCQLVSTLLALVAGANWTQ